MDEKLQKEEKKNNFIHHISSGEIIQGSKANFQLEKRERKEQVRESFDMLYKSVPKWIFAPFTMKNQGES